MDTMATSCVLYRWTPSMGLSSAMGPLGLTWRAEGKANPGSRPGTAPNGFQAFVLG